MTLFLSVAFQRIIGDDCGEDIVPLQISVPIAERRLGKFHVFPVHPEVEVITTWKCCIVEVPYWDFPLPRPPAADDLVSIGHYHFSPNILVHWFFEQSSLPRRAGLLGTALTIPLPPWIWRASHLRKAPHQGIEQHLESTGRAQPHPSSQSSRSCGCGSSASHPGRTCRKRNVNWKSHTKENKQKTKQKRKKGCFFVNLKVLLFFWSLLLY